MKEHEESKIVVEEEQGATDSPDDERAEKDFEITVRKLELPVKPRGVLAE